MRTALLLAGLALCPFFAWSQERFVNADYRNYYQWFQQNSQASDLYREGSQLYIFSEMAKVHQLPCRDSEVLAELAGGDAVFNIAYDESRLPEDVIDGYGDIWFHVRGQAPNGKAFRGYIWGADLARGWRRADITGDHYPEFIMLGIASLPRRQLREINAELRVLQNGRLLAQAIIPGLCIFQECDTDALLRIIRDPSLGTTIIETSTIFAGCEVGIEKAFFYWNGHKLECIFHAEFTTHKEYARKEFSFPLKAKTSDSDNGMAVKVCHFSHEDQSFNPVWECQTLMQQPGPAKESELLPSPGPKARAR